jgi:hypothetical protein
VVLLKQFLSLLAQLRLKCRVWILINLLLLFLLSESLNPLFLLETTPLVHDLANLSLNLLLLLLLDLFMLSLQKLLLAL